MSGNLIYSPEQNRLSLTFSLRIMLFKIYYHKIKDSIADDVINDI